MPIRIADNLPARHILEQERIFVMEENRALSQDIRPIRIVILNLMPDKSVTETQLLRALSNSPIQVDIELLFTRTHQSTHTPAEHLIKYYRTFPEMTLHLCWGAFAGLYYHYGIPKIVLDKKVFGVFEHSMTWSRPVKLFRGFDDIFYVPHSRYTEVRREDVEKRADLRILSESEECGIYAISDLHGRQFFITGHSEYDRDTLDKEYQRDLKAGLGDVDLPKNYYIDDDPSKGPLLKWRSSATLMYTNWLNYYVYQETPFDINSIKTIRNEDLVPNRDLEKNG